VEEVIVEQVVVADVDSRVRVRRLKLRTSHREAENRKIWNRWIKNTISVRMFLFKKIFVDGDAGTGLSNSNYRTVGSVLDLAPTASILHKNVP
jgi:hypothetical protein